MGFDMEKLLKGLECVDVKILDEGFALLFDDGVVLYVSSLEDVTITTGLAWHDFWNELTK